jgi:tetratricopeptide (TPR) repeat protein
VSFAHVSCPDCNARLRIAASTPADAPIRCPKCGARFRLPGAAQEADPGITTAEGKTAPQPPAIVPEDRAELLRKIRRPAPLSRKVLWVVSGALAAGLLLAGGGAVGYWLTRPSAPPPSAANVGPSAPAGVPPGRFVPPVLPAAAANNPGAWFEQGNLCLHRGDNGGAVIAYTRAIALDPRLAAAYCNRGLAHSHMGAFDAAIADETKAIELDPTAPFPFINRANARILKGVDPDASIADATRALELRPGIPAALLNRGMARDQKGDCDGAIADYDAALTLLPVFDCALLQRGQTWMKKEKWAKAEADFTRLLELDPARPAAYQFRGTCRQQLKNRQGALEDFNAAIRLDPLGPQSAASYFHRARFAFVSGNLEAARADVDRALANALPAGGPGPANGQGTLPLHALRAKILLCAGESDLALVAAENLVKLQPRSPEALLCRAGIRAWRGEDDQALADFSAALAVDPKNVAGHLLRGWFYLSADRMEEAARDADAGLKVAGRRHSQSPYLAILAHCARRRQNPDEARRAAAEALNAEGEKGWPEPVLRYLHGDLSAEELLRAAGDDDDRQTEARAYVGVVLWVSGAAAKAREHFEWVRDHGNRDFVEYDLAVLLLHRLNEGPARKS